MTLQQDASGALRSGPDDARTERDEVTLSCRPPRGEPEPRVSWARDGEAVRANGRVTIGRSGVLKIRNVRPSDAGLYFCRASNIAGQLESKPAKLSVKGLLQKYYNIVPF